MPIYPGGVTANDFGLLLFGAVSEGLFDELARPMPGGLDVGVVGASLRGSQAVEPVQPYYEVGHPRQLVLHRAYMELRESVEYAGEDDSWPKNHISVIMVRLFISHYLPLLL